MLASHAQWFCPDVVRLLLAYGAEVDAPRPCVGETALHLLARTIHGTAFPDKELMRGLWEIARVLLLHGADLSDAVQEQLRGSNNYAWPELLRKEHTDEEHRRFMRQVEQNANTSYVFEALCLFRDRQIEALKAYGEHLQSQEGLPKVLVELVMDPALTDPQKRRLRKLEQQNQGTE